MARWKLRVIKTVIVPSGRWLRPRRWIWTCVWVCTRDACSVACWASGSGSTTCGLMTWRWPTWWRLADCRGKHLNQLPSPRVRPDVLLWTVLGLLSSRVIGSQEGAHNTLYTGVSEWRLWGGAGERPRETRVPAQTRHRDLLHSAISPQKGVCALIHTI